jgi:sigma-B regulation protein RsbU (phosphoserine phosphatase)
VLTYANAGHNPPILVRADGSSARLTQGGTVLGVFPDWAYEQQQMAIGAGDRLVLFTDGISEAQDADGEEFGEDRLVDIAAAARRGAASDVQTAIFDAVRAFNGGTYTDDATLIVIAMD